jgi:phospholipid/cholesterol/gamma-HCH transport system substrate-binding protein
VNETMKNTNEMVAQINKGNGAVGKLMHDKAFAQKLEDTVTNLDGILKSINTGEGTIGQLVNNRTIADNLNKTLDSTHELIEAFRANPKKYLTIQMKVF